MPSRRHITRTDIVILLIAVLILLSDLAAVGTTGRERAKRAVCMANLRQLTLAWIRYADDNDGKLVNGDTGEYVDMHPEETPWVLRDWRSSMTVAEKERAIRQGTLYAYTGDLRLYKCPVGGVAETRSYAAVDSMNVYGMLSRVTLKNRSDIQFPGQRFVFIDCGGTEHIALGGWTCYPDYSERWWDPPPIRHNDGTVFSFVDGHVEYRQWTDPRTIEFGQGMTAFSAVQPGNPDIRDTQLGVWGAGTQGLVESTGRR